MSDDINNGSQDLSRVMERIRKLLRLANDAAASEGERDNAMRMAHSTLAKYNLSLAEVEARGTKTDDRGHDSDLVTVDFPWAIRCAAAVAELFFCEYLVARVRAGKTRHYFIGRAANAVTAREIANHVINSILRESNRETRRLGENGTWQRSFCKGAADKVWVRARKLRQDAERENVAEVATKTPGTAIVLASYYKQEQTANRALIKAKLGVDLDAEKGRPSREQRARSDAYMQGSEYGDKVSLHRQISQKG